MGSARSTSYLFAVVLLLAAASQTRGGIIKDIYQKITNTNNKTDDTVKQSAPICGSGTFSTPDERSLSPEIIFITNRPSRSTQVHANHDRDHESDGRRQTEGDLRRRPSQAAGRRPEQVSEVAKEFRFHVENVTIEDLERHGFNRDAPVSFLMHGFTSGYPLQAWISAIVESYTIDRETAASGPTDRRPHQGQHHSSSGHDDYQHGSGQHGSSHSNKGVSHNLFVVNWHYAARGILYPRAVANIPIVASYVTRFINNKLLDEAQVDPRRIQLIGHSLGAHLAGFIGKNTRTKLGRIYGLDPAGPCFGSITGPLYPSSKRLAPGDADEVITIHTNSALLGIDKPLGRYSVFVEGGEKQPGCKGGGALASLNAVTLDGGDFDTIACSHSRAPNLLTYRHNQHDAEDDCQLMAFGCKDWDSFLAGHCGVCRSEGGRRTRAAGSSPTEPVECLRIGLDWQYPGLKQDSVHGHGGSQQRPHQAGDHSASSSYGTNDFDGAHNDQSQWSTTRRPYSSSSSLHNGFSSSGGNNGSNNYQRDNEQYAPSSSSSSNGRRNKNTTRRPPTFSGDSSWSDSGDRRRRATSADDESSEDQVASRRSRPGGVEALKLFMRTGDTQPYCTYHYQVILELSEPFKGKKPPMSIILQDSRPDGQHQAGRSGRQRQEQNSLSNDEFGNKFDEYTYTHLLTSNKKLNKIDHVTLIFRNGLDNGQRHFKAIRVNYMSHSDPEVRRRLSSRLCPTRTDADRARDQSAQQNRFYFEPCDRPHDSHHQTGNHGTSSREPSIHGSSGDQYGRENHQGHGGSHGGQAHDHSANHNQGGHSGHQDEHPEAHDTGSGHSNHKNHDSTNYPRDNNNYYSSSSSNNNNNNYNNYNNRNRNSSSF